MKKYLFLFIAIIFSYCAPSTSVEAKSEAIPSINSETQETCPQTTPNGWVVISYRACAGCCGAPGIIQMPTIERIDNLPSGTVLEICPQPVPDGWILVGTHDCAGCCGRNGEIVHKPVIKKL